MPQWLDNISTVVIDVFHLPSNKERASKISYLLSVISLVALLILLIQNTQFNYRGIVFALLVVTSVTLLLVGYWINKPFFPKIRLSFNSFGEKEGESFLTLGRKKDVSEILKLINWEINHIILIEGERGVGKTSLLRAGIKFHFYYQKDVDSEYFTCSEEGQDNLSSSIKQFIRQNNNPEGNSLKKLVLLDNLSWLDDNSLKEVVSTLKVLIEDKQNAICFIIASENTETRTRGRIIDVLNLSKERLKLYSLKSFDRDVGLKILYKLLGLKNLNLRLRDLVKNLVELFSENGTISPKDLIVCSMVMDYALRFASLSSKEKWDSDNLLRDFLQFKLLEFDWNSIKVMLKALLEDQELTYKSAKSNYQISGEEIHRLRLVGIIEVKEGPYPSFKLSHDALANPLESILQKEELSLLKADALKKRDSLKMAFFLSIATLVLLVVGFFWGYRNFSIEEREMFKNWELPPDLYDKYKEANHLFLSVQNMNNLNWSSSEEILRSLTLYMNSGSAFSQQEDLSALNELIIQKKVEELSFMKHFIQLEHLSMFRVTYLDFEIISKLKKLKELEIYINRNVKLKNLGSVTDLDSLKMLKMIFEGPYEIRSLSNYSFLSDIKNLEQLELEGRFDQIFIEQLPALDKLTLSLLNDDQDTIINLDKFLSQELSSFELKSRAEVPKKIIGLRNLSNLESLVIEASLDSLSAVLSQLSNLNGELNHLKLSLKNQNQLGLSGFENLSKLESLDLDISNTGIKNLRNLEELMNLRKLILQLGGSEISNLRFLSRFVGLEELSVDFGNSAIKDIDVLLSNFKLKYLDLTFDQGVVSDLRILSRLDNLESLKLSLEGPVLSNTDSILSIITELKELKSLSVSLPYSDLCHTNFLKKSRGLTKLEIKARSLVNLDWRAILSLENLNELQIEMTRTVDYAELDWNAIKQLKLNKFSIKGIDFNAESKLDWMPQKTDSLWYTPISIGYSIQ